MQGGARTVAGAVAGTNTQTGSSPESPLKISVIQARAIGVAEKLSRAWRTTWLTDHRKSSETVIEWFLHMKMLGKDPKHVLSSHMPNSCSQLSFEYTLGEQFIDYMPYGIGQSEED